MKKNKKLILTLLSLIILIPFYVNADQNAPSNSYDIPVRLPEIGEHPSYAIDDDVIEITNQYWRNITDDEIVDATGIFEANKRYEFNVEFNLKVTSYSPNVDHFLKSPYSIGGGSSSGTTSGSAGWEFYMGNKDDLNATTGAAKIEDNSIIIKNKKLTKPNIIINEDAISFVMPGTWFNSSNQGLPDDYEVEVGKTYKYVINLYPVFKFNSDFEVINNNTETNIDECYQFVSDSTTVSKDGSSATYTAYYKAIPEKTYKVYFYQNIYLTTSVNQTMTYNKEENLRKNTWTRTGYTFKEWNTDNRGAGTSYQDEQLVKNLTDQDSIALYAIWEPKSYQIAFDANGGEGSMENQAMTNNVASYLNPLQFTRNGYYFSHWCDQTNYCSNRFNSGKGYKNQESIQLVTDEEQITFYAIWKPISYWFKFNSNDGKNITKNQEMYYDHTYNLRENEFEREGYIFKGWNTEPDGSGTSYANNQEVFNITNVNETINVYAQWEPITYTIRYHSNNGKQDILEQEVTYDETVKLLKNTFKYQDKVFIGWTTDNSGNDVVYQDEQSVKNLIKNPEAVNLYAAWKKPRILYKTHVQSYGWQDYVKDGEMSGTEGKAKRLEGIKIKLENEPYPGSIVYSTHVQSYGWQDFVSDGALSGTEGEAKRLEAIKIKLAGELANRCDIYYRVHAQKFGWLGWARNGEPSGTAGYAYRLEGIEIIIVPKGQFFEEYGKKYTFADKETGRITPIPDNSLVTYTTHVQSYGWQNYVADGQMAGTSGEAKRLEGIKIKLENQKYTGNIEYRTHIQSYGWEEEFKKNDAISGTEGEAKRLEAIQIKLTGEMADHYDIYYRVHAQSYGWLGWSKNGEKSGTAGFAKRLEGIEIILVNKGEQPPQRDNQNDERSYIENT